MAWAGVCDLYIDNIVITEEEPAATGSPVVIVNAPGRRGIGANTEGGATPWGP
jgi:hypothetical protein